MVYFCIKQNLLLFFCNFLNFFNVENSKQQTFLHLKTHYDNLVSFNEVNNIFVSREETFPMKTNLDMGNDIIHNVKNDINNDGVVNKGYVDQADNSLVQVFNGRC